MTEAFRVSPLDVTHKLSCYLDATEAKRWADTPYTPIAETIAASFEADRTGLYTARSTATFSAAQKTGAARSIRAMERAARPAPTSGTAATPTQTAMRV